MNSVEIKKLDLHFGSVEVLNDLNLEIEKGELEKDKLELFEKMVTRSLFGNINASRNSA